MQEAILVLLCPAPMKTRVYTAGPLRRCSVAYRFPAVISESRELFVEVFYADPVLSKLAGVEA
jgi:hypothetical protein